MRLIPEVKMEAILREDELTLSMLLAFLKITRIFALVVIID